jgi:hypothetical protein
MLINEWSAAGGIQSPPRGENCGGKGKIVMTEGKEGKFKSFHGTPQGEEGKSDNSVGFMCIFVTKLQPVTRFRNIAHTSKISPKSSLERPPTKGATGARLGMGDM